MFKNAYQIGKSDAAEYLKSHRQDHELIEESIFVLIASNPYKSEKQRKMYFDGVSEWVNMIARSEAKKVNGQYIEDAGLKYYK